MNFADPVTYIIISSIILVLAAIVLVIGKEKLIKGNEKKIFMSIVVVTILPTIFLVGETIYHNILSETKGPVHWHADYQVWACDEKLDLIDPTGLKNKIGSPLFHEHNDDRIHVEGTVSVLADIDFGSYFAVVGAELRQNGFSYPTNDGVVSFNNGDLCGGEEGEMKVYVNGVHEPDAENYQIYPDPNVPPGDCIIVEFGTNLADTTERICDSWVVNDWTYQNYERESREVAHLRW